MSHAGRYGNIDYRRWAKGGFLLGIVTFVGSALAELAISLSAITVPAWTHTLFLDLEILGVLLALFAPIVFAIVLPLTE